MKKYRIWTL